MPQQINGSLFSQRQDYTRKVSVPNPMLDVNNDHAIRRPRNPELSRYAPSPTGGYSPPTSSPVQRSAPPVPASVDSPMQPVPFAPLLPGTGDSYIPLTPMPLPFPMASPYPGPPTPAPASPSVGMGDVRQKEQNDYLNSVVQGGNPLFNMALPLQLTPGVMGAGMANLAGSFGNGFARDRSNVNHYEMMNGAGSASSGPWDARAVQQQQSEAFAGQLPYPGSSPQAGLMTGTVPGNLQNPVTMGPGNGYNGYVADVNNPNRVGPEQAYALAQQAAPDNSRYNNPMGEGGRFRQGSAMMNQANAIAAGQASSTGPNATTYELPQGYGNVPVYNPLRPAPEVQYRSNGQGQQVSYIPQNGPNIDPVLARQNAALKNRGSEAWQADRRQKAENRKERRATEKTRRDDVKFKHMVRQGMNPMSPQAKALFPEQTGGLAGGAPDIKDTPFAPNAPLTPDNARKAETMQSNMLSGYTDATGKQHPPEPLWPAIGVEAGASIRDVHFGLYDYLNGGSDLSPADLNSLHQYAVLEKQNAVDGEDPFRISRWYSMAEGWGEDSARAHDSVYASLWRELSEIPVGAPPRVLQAWETKYREAQKAVRDKAVTPSGHNNPARMSQP
jgi:hypothetical protein